jgi:hypothetical protein
MFPALSRRLPMRRDAVVSVICAVLTLILVAVPVSAYGQFSVLHNLGSATGEPRNPVFDGIIAQGRDGNLYTTTAYNDLHHYHGAAVASRKPSRTCPGRGTAPLGEPRAPAD